MHAFFIEVPTKFHLSNIYLYLMPFDTVQVYGFSWIVLLVMIILFKVYSVNCSGLHILHVFKV